MRKFMFLLAVFCCLSFVTANTIPDDVSDEITSVVDVGINSEIVASTIAPIDVSPEILIKSEHYQLQLNTINTLYSITNTINLHEKQFALSNFTKGTLISCKANDDNDNKPDIIISTKKIE